MAESGFAGMTNASADAAKQRSLQIYKNSESPFQDGVEFEVDTSKHACKGEQIAGNADDDDRNGYGYQQAVYANGSKGERLSPVLWVKLLTGNSVGKVVPMFLSMILRSNYGKDNSNRSADGEFVDLVKRAISENEGKSEGEVFTAVVKKTKGVRWRLRTEPYAAINYSGGNVTRHQFHINKAD